MRDETWVKIRAEGNLTGKEIRQRGIPMIIMARKMPVLSFIEHLIKAGVRLSDIEVNNWDTRPVVYILNKPYKRFSFRDAQNAVKFYYKRLNKVVG